MTALKIIGLVFLCIAVIVLILLLCPIKAELRFASDTPFVYKIRYLFVGYNSDKKSENKTKSEKNEKKKTDIKKTVETVFSVLKKIPYLLKKIRVDKLKIKYVCGSDDAADTAIRYGVICSVIYPFSAFIAENANCKKSPEVSVSADFSAEEDDYGFHIKLHTLLIFALITLLKISGEFIQKGETGNGTAK